MTICNVELQQTARMIEYTQGLTPAAALAEAERRVAACRRIDSAHSKGQLTDSERNVCARTYECDRIRLEEPALGVSVFGETRAQFRDRLLDEYTADFQAQGMGYATALIEAERQFDEMFRET